MKRSKLLPVILIVIAASIWGSDSFVRYPATLSVDSRILVLMEHLFGLIAILPWTLIHHRSEIKKIRWQDLLPLLVIGIAGSSLGGVFNTASVRALGPSASVLFQLIQPVFVIALAYFFLRERGTAKYLQCAIWVAMNFALIAYAGSGFGVDFSDSGALRSGALFGLAAAMMWGMSTVAGKWLLFRLSPIVVTAGRFVVAIAFMATWIAVEGVPVPWQELAQPAVLLTCLFLGTIAGSISFIIYYNGLRRLPASLVTFIELIYPIGGALLPMVLSGSKLSLLQGFGLLNLALALILLIISEGVSLPAAEPEQVPASRSAS